MRNAAIFLLLLIPSAHYAWITRDAPAFGKNHDDAILFSSAKSLASGQGFKVASLPEKPPQTKYPVLYPLYLSAVWRINPSFPANLNLATFFSWPLLALCLALTMIFWRSQQLGEIHTWIVIAVLAISPYMILFGSSLFSEIFFMCWLIGVFVVAGKQGLAMAALAGALAGCAYLSRTAGIALIVSMPAWYLWRRESRRAIAFAAGMLPFVLGWTIWSASSKVPAPSLTLIYYTDYVKFEFLNVGFDNFVVVFWKNIDALIYSMGSLIVPQVIVSLPVKMLTDVVAIAMISGVVRLAKRGIGTPYAFFAIVSSVMLIVWHFPPTERFVLPIFPLLAAGFVTELENLAHTIRKSFNHKDISQRVVAGAFACFVAGILAAALAIQFFVTFKAMPADAESDRARLAETRKTYSWIAENLPAGSPILSNDDPLLYLYTNHPGNAAPLLPRWWYSGETEKFAAFFNDVVPYLKSRNYDYFLSTPDDVKRWTGEDAPTLQPNPQLKSVYQSPTGSTVYKLTQ